MQLKGSRPRAAASSLAVEFVRYAEVQVTWDRAVDVTEHEEIAAEIVGLAAVRSAGKAGTTEADTGSH